MRAILIQSAGQIVLGELPTPDYGPYEALVRVEACGICNGTDTKLIDGEFLPGTFPSALGHESVGRVIQRGKRVSSFEIGDRVLRPMLYDRHVPGGRSTWGGMAEYGVVIDAHAIQSDGNVAPIHWVAPKQQKVPAGISPAEAVTLVTLKETLHFVQTFGIGIGASVAIVGTGPAAEGFCYFSKHLGAVQVVIFARSAGYRERFLSRGADAYVLGDDYPEIVRDRLGQGGFSHVIEAVGSREALQRCLSLAGEKGQVRVYGIAPASRPWEVQDLQDARVERLGAKEDQVHSQMLQLVRDGQVRLDEWPSHILPLAEYSRAFEMVRNKIASKAVLMF